jgi:anaerobic ribonucleoside-triphosphate reductase activating protein
MNASISSNPLVDIGGLVPLSTTDYPGGHLAAVLFLQGCPWRCGYCHNPALQPRRLAQTLRWAEVERFLDKRVGLLDAVVISGGEPTVHAGLARLIDRIRAKGFGVGLHTAGIYPRRLAEVLPRVDWVGFDVKARFDDYARVIRRSGGGSAADESLQRVLDSGVDYEVRLTWHSELFAPEGVLEIANALARRGVRRFALQEFRATGCRDIDLIVHPVEPMPRPILEAIERLFPRFEHRRAEELLACA